ncbi:MAG: DUF2807 domain-containing protein [Flavobacteriales bacterium]|jgi:hypothetical protein|nr:DUF2807 domain-containing protein [Flavobacteriales bacterium]
MINKLLLFAFVCISSLLQAQNSYENNHKIAREFEISEFTNLRCVGDFTVYLRQDSMSRLEMASTEEALKNMQVDIDGKQMIISNKNTAEQAPVEVFLRYKQIDLIELMGQVELQNKLLCAFDSLKIKAYGGSQIEVNFAVKKMEVNLNTQAEMMLKSGIIDTLKIEQNENSQFSLLETAQVFKVFSELYDFSQATIQSPYTLNISLEDPDTKLTLLQEPNVLNLEKQHEKQVVLRFKTLKE